MGSIDLGLTLTYLAVALAGALVGLTELVSRYRDAPLKALFTLPAMVYILLNGLASYGALALIQHQNWFVKDGAPDGSTLLVQAVIAGLGAMAFFRSAVFTVRVGKEDVSVGPAGLLKVLLDAADRACDRERAGPRAKDVARIMKDIAFDKAKSALPAFCFELMQNVSSDEQKALGTEINLLATNEMDETVKVNNLGLALMNVVGVGVLESAVEILRDRISAPPRAIVQSIATLQLLKNLDFDTQGMSVAQTCLFIAGKSGDDGLRGTLDRRFREVAAIHIDGDQKTLMLSAFLLDVFGEEILQAALRAQVPAPAAQAQAQAQAPAPQAANVVPIDAVRAEGDG